ncbi:adrenocortical dysplasia protein homolog isoform X2 [Pithys albifrons albifrons]|uniref:adrenocortical dysplasia protein homolog isoform X2 n=1 Tax=Pithys albifrons albifrons TaxID=3385563 RepID=UPI003A5CFD06
MAAAAAPPGAGGETERGPPELPGLEAADRFVFVDKNMASHKVCVLQPWIVNLLVNEEQPDDHENFLAGQVVRVLSDSTASDQPGVLQDSALQVSDGSYYIRVVITPEALQAEENAHMQLKLSSLTCRFIVLQKYTVCFQEEDRLEDCEFYLTAQRFIVLPMQRQRMESSDGNQEPSVMKKIKELWLKNLSVRSAPSSEPSITQLIDAIGQNQLEILKENAEECLDLEMPKDKPVMVTDEVPVTKWEAERKKEQGEDVFMVPVNTLVIPPEEEEVTCDSSTADRNKTIPGKSSSDRTVPGEPSVVSQASHAESLALSDSLEGSLDNPWNRMPPLSLTRSSSNEKTLQPDTSLKMEKGVAADSQTPDLLDLCSLDSPEGLPQGEPVQTTSPSLLCSYRNSTPVETGTSQAASPLGAACDAPCTAQGLQGPSSSQATLTTLSPVFPVLPSSSLQAMPDRMPHREQVCSSGTAFSPDVLKPGPAHARTQEQDAVGARRKISVAPGGQQHLQSTPKGRRTGMGRRSELMSPRGAKKSRKESGLRHGKELEEEQEEEPASSSLGSPSSTPQQHRALQPYVRKPARYKYKASSPRLCKQIQSVRISQMMLKWACWILTEEEDS